VISPENSHRCGPTMKVYYFPKPMDFHIYSHFYQRVIGFVLDIVGISPGFNKGTYLGYNRP
jgi:hypothetical protein